MRKAELERGSSRGFHAHWLPALWVLCLGLLILLTACQGSSQGTTSPRPRSREAAGDNANLPFEAITSSRKPVDDTGGELEYKQCRIVIPRGAVDEAVFFEISVPGTAPDGDVFPESSYQVNPGSLELRKDALLAIRYSEEDVPQGKDESRIVIVQKINNIWIELSNSKVYIHNNTVEAPIRFLGQFALRLASEDPRALNIPPDARFEFKDSPYPGQRGDSAAQVNQQAEVAAGKKQAEEQQAVETDKNAEDAGETVGCPSEEGQVSSGLVQRRFVGAPESATQPPGANDDELRRRREADQLGGQSNRDAGSRGQEADSSQAGPKTDASVAEAAAPQPRFGPKPGQVGRMEGDGAAITVYFSALSSKDPDGTIVQYDWDWDADGVFDFTSHSSPYAEHTFEYNGDYSVVLKVTDNGRYAQSGYSVGTVEVRSAKVPPKPLAANISCYPPFGPCPLTVHFAATITGGTAPYIYKWTFSDGSTSNLPNPFTTYPSPGTYRVTFSVTDIKGGRLSGTLVPCVQDKTAPGSPQPRMQLGITPSVERGQAPFKARFNLSTERAAEPVTYRVTFGDEAPGSPELVTTQASLEHTYTNTGFYVIKVVATDAELRTGSTFATVHAYSPEDARDFTASAMGYEGDPFSFGHEIRITFDYIEASKRSLRLSAADTPKPASELSFNWDFGDGTYSTEVRPSHTYAKDGVYEIRVTASDGIQRWRQRIWLPVSQQKPAVAIQRPAYIEGPAPLKLVLHALVTRGEEPLSYDWSIGEQRRSDASPRLSLSQPGETTVKLSVKDRNKISFDAPPVVVRVRPGAVDYALPLAVISPQSGSARAVVVDHSGAAPLPLSAPGIDGIAKLTDLSHDGQHVGIVTSDGLIVRRVRDGAAVLSFLPATGEINRLRVVPVDGSVVAFVGLVSAAGATSWIVKPGANPQRIGSGFLAAVAGDGSVALLAPKQDGSVQDYKQYRIDPGSGQIGEAADFGKAVEAVLSIDGRIAFYISSDSRIVRRNTRNGEQEFIGSGKDLKRGLCCSGNGRALAFSVPLGTSENIIVGRQTQDGEWRLASVSDQTGWHSSYNKLSADGRFLFSYGSRAKLADLLAAVGTQDKAGPNGQSPVDGEETPLVAAQGKPGPPVQRERFGIVRLDLSPAPLEWDIKSVNPRFVYECNANFSVAGPFD